MQTDFGMLKNGFIFQERKPAQKVGYTEKKSNEIHPSVHGFPGQSQWKIQLHAQRNAHLDEIFVLSGKWRAVDHHFFTFHI
jgi:hypothetical protein